MKIVRVEADRWIPLVEQGPLMPASKPKVASKRKITSLNDVARRLTELRLKRTRNRVHQPRKFKLEEAIEELLEM